jgi:hypothetical protein
LHDAHDTTTPIADVYPLLHKKLDHVHFYFTEGLGHSGIYRDNKVKKRIIEFFSQDTVANEIQPAESGF